MVCGIGLTRLFFQIMCCISSPPLSATGRPLTQNGLRDMPDHLSTNIGWSWEGTLQVFQNTWARSLEWGQTRSAQGSWKSIWITRIAGGLSPCLAIAGFLHEATATKSFSFARSSACQPRESQEIVNQPAQSLGQANSNKMIQINSKRISQQIQNLPISAR